MIKAVKIMDEYIKRSAVTGKKYDYFSKDYVRIVNPRQSMAYLSNGAELIDIYTSRDRTTGKPILIYVFTRESTKELYDAWCNHELEIVDES